MRRLAPLAASLVLALPAAAPAVEVNDGQLSLHGDGQWSYQRTDDRNALGEAVPGGNYDTAMFDVMLTVRPSDELVISAQLGFDPVGTDLEWAFAEWRHSERLRLRVGKVQQPFGNLNELRFAGTTRAFYDLPPGLYGPGNVTGRAYLGLGLVGELLGEGRWSLGYDLYAGAVRLAELENYRGLVAGAETADPVAPDEQQARDLVGGRLSLATPWEVTLRVSGYGGRLQKDAQASDGFLVAGLSAEHRGERLWLSVEGAFTDEIGSERAWTAYGVVAWFLTERLQVAGRYELQRTHLEHLDPRFPPSHPLLRHDQLTLGLNYWFNPSLVVRASWAHVEGNRFAFPREGAAGPLTVGELVDPALELQRHTNVLVVGTQFAF